MRADHLLRDTIASNEAHAIYSESHARLIMLAHDLEASRKPLTAGIYRQRAYVAQRAARAELLDPEPTT